jgi:hypothetical protein
MVLLKWRQNGRIIPPAPDKSVVGTTKIKMAKESGDNLVHDEVFNILQHVILFKDEISSTAICDVCSVDRFTFFKLKNIK